MEQPKTDYDSPWKEILDVYFQHFMALCWQEHYNQIEWSKGYKTLDKELNKISREAPITAREADKLIEVCLKDGQAAFILIHIEIQASRDQRFEERMLVYRYRIRDLYKKPIASLGVLIDSDENWKPGIYKEELWGSKIEIQFPIIKLLDYKARIKELEASSNPFSEVVLAQLAAMEKQNPEARLVSKLELTRRLYTKGWQKEDILILYKFIDWVLALPAPLELNYFQEIEKIEEDLKVAYITSAERIGMQRGLEKGIEQGMQQGIQKGMQKGMQQGERTLLECLLQDKFKNIPENYRQAMEQANAESLLRWGRRVLNSETIEEVFKD